MTKRQSMLVMTLLGMALAAGAEFVGRCLSAAVEFGMPFPDAVAIAAFYTLISGAYAVGYARIIR